MPRGRPKGSKNRTTEEKQATRKAVDRAMAQNDQITSRKSQELSPEVKEEGLKSTIDYKPFEKNAYDSEKIMGYVSDEFGQTGKMVPPFPPDWDKMGKVDRLKWLTEHRK